MKAATLFYTALLVMGSSSLFAQTGAQDGSRFGKGEDSVRCITNISLYEPYAKSNNFKDALPYWELAFAECPAASKNLYIYGVKIVEWQIKQEKDPAKRKALADKLMGVYDQRIKYFGDDRTYPAARLKGMKAVDHVKYYGKDSDFEKAYGWFDEAIKSMGYKVGPQVLKEYVSSASKIFKKNPDFREQYLNTYQQGVALLDEYMPTSSAAMQKYTGQVKDFLAAELANSGAADCEALQAMFAPKIEASKTDIEFLKSTLALLRKTGCTETDAYFAASGYAHAIEPTLESAMGIAKQAYKKEDMQQALAYFKEADALATDPADKAEINLLIASIYNSMRNYSQARAFALKSLAADPNQATPYMMIANMYAQTSKSVYPSDPIMAQAVYYAAVDKLEKGRAAEPAKAAEINSMISSYRQRFPSVQDVFMHKDLEKGKPVTIGGWIQERTIVR